MLNIRERETNKMKMENPFSISFIQYICMYKQNSIFLKLFIFLFLFYIYMFTNVS